MLHCEAARIGWERYLGTVGLLRSLRALELALEPTFMAATVVLVVSAEACWEQEVSRGELAADGAEAGRG